MILIFTGGGHSVVTTGAAAGDSYVVEVSRSECIGGVAQHAILHGRNVIRRLTLGDHAVVASPAICDNARMVEHRTGKIGGVMARTAIL